MVTIVIKNTFINKDKERIRTELNKKIEKILHQTCKVMVVCNIMLTSYIYGVPPAKRGFTTIRKNLGQNIRYSLRLH